MPPTSDKIASEFHSALQSAGLRHTYQRLVIYRALVKSKGHPTAQDIHKVVVKELQSISLDTVYRTLWIFVEIGLTNTLGPKSGENRFDPNLSQHHHYICSHCGLIQDFQNASFDELKPPRSIENWGSTARVQVEFTGYCKGCKDKQKPSHYKLVTTDQAADSSTELAVSTAEDDEDVWRESMDKIGSLAKGVEHNIKKGAGGLLDTLKGRYLKSSKNLKEDED